MNVRLPWAYVFRAVTRGWRCLWYDGLLRKQLSRRSGRMTSGGLLGPGVAFRLHSPVRRDDPALPEEMRGLIRQHRSRFTDGVLFVELSRRMSATTVLTAHIVEEGHDQCHHLLAIYPHSSCFSSQGIYPER